MLLYHVTIVAIGHGFLKKFWPYGNRLRSTHCGEFHCKKLCRPAYYSIINLTLAMSATMDIIRNLVFILLVPRGSGLPDSRQQSENFNLSISCTGICYIVLLFSYLLSQQIDMRKFKQN